MLLALQARDRVRGQVCSGLYVLADSRSEAAAEVNGTTDLFLSAMRGVAGDGASPEGALNMVAWEMIRELVSAEPSLNEAAWESLRGMAGLLTAGDEGESSRKYRRVG